MRIKTLGWWVLACAVGAVTFDSSTAGAVMHVHSPMGVCRNFNAGEALTVDNFTYGVRSIAAGGQTIVCPVPRTTQQSENITEDWGYQVLSNSDSVPMSCTLYAISNTGNIRTSMSFTPRPNNYCPTSFQPNEKCYGADVVPLFKFPGGAAATNSGDFITLLCSVGPGAVLRQASAIIPD
jgi:hypothetical protein